jgi:N-carbamoyl-L-amino-acid hydrolase
VRYAPDMMGSLVYAGGLSTEAALATIGTEGSVLGEELTRIGYSGAQGPGFLKPYAYVEIHVEQGPVLEREGVPIGAVENLQGISRQRITIDGVANHAGTTPMSMRRDAGHAAARVPARSRNGVQYADRRHGGLYRFRAERDQRDSIARHLQRRSPRS